MTGLTKDGQAVASTSYNLYGVSKASTDTTGNPFAYNGEARDDTGLDYLRARYYDSQGGTFLTEDSYPGEATDPLSQNRYSYVQNNPVNYTDPSGHRMIWMGGEGEPSRPRRINTRLQRIYQQSIVGQDILGRPLTLREYTDHRIKTDRTFRAPESYYQAFGPNVATYQSSYADAQQQVERARAQAEQRRRQQIRYEYGLATGINSSPTIREGLNLDRNWNTSLQNTLKHVCNPKTTKGQDDATKKHLTASELRQLVKKTNSGDVSAIAALSRSYDGKSGIGTGIRTKEEIAAGNRRVWQNTVDGFKTINNIRNKVGNAVLELLSVNDVHRVITGEDPVTGEDASRIEAASSIILDIAALKLGKIAKGLKATKEALRGLDALNDASKATKAADKAKDASKAAKAAEKASDAGKLFNPPKLDKLSPKEIVELNIQELKERLPEGWTFNEHNGRVHIKNSKGDYKIRIDPPDRITDYNHMHIYDKNGQPLDINGNIVNRKSPDAHIPWDKY